MFDEMLEVARNKLATVNEIIDGLPEPQVTILLTNHHNIYVGVNDVDGLICEKIKQDKDTMIIKMLTMWKGGRLDLSSRRFRNALIKMNDQNNHTDIILQGKEGYLIKKLAETIF